MKKTDKPSKYSKDDFKKISFKDYEKTLKILHHKVKKYLEGQRIRVDAVVPILRGGAFPGAYLAYKLQILAMLSIQYKYFFDGKKALLKRLADFPKYKFSLPLKPTFLLVESNHCFGITAQTTVDDLKTEFPRCKIIYAVDHMDASFQKIDGVEASFYGKLTDETRVLNEKEAKKLGVEKGVSYLLPWEELDEEWTTVQGKQYGYQDSQTDGEIKKEMKLGEDYL